MPVRVRTSGCLFSIAASIADNGGLVKSVYFPRAILPTAAYVAGPGEIAYFAQHQMDKLKPEWTPFEHVVDLMPTEHQEGARRMEAAAGTTGRSARPSDRCR